MITHTGAGSIFYATTDGKKGKDSLLVIRFFWRNGDKQVSVQYNINGTKKRAETLLVLAPSAFQYTKIVVTHRLEDGEYKFSIFMNDQLEKSVTNTVPKNYSNLKYYSGSPWMKPANVLLANLHFGSGRFGLPVDVAGLNLSSAVSTMPTVSTLPVSTTNQQQLTSAVVESSSLTTNPLVTTTTMLPQSVDTVATAGSCPYQKILDDYCGKMVKKGVGEFGCNKAKNVKMVARWSLNSKGKSPAWRCYGKFLSTNNQAACIKNDGTFTSEGCSDPDYRSNILCNRMNEMDVMVWDTRAACQVTATRPASTTATVFTQTTIITTASTSSTTTTTTTTTIITPNSYLSCPTLPQLYCTT